jgi:hypothetical protein
MKWRLFSPVVIIILTIILLNPPTLSQPPNDPDNPVLTLEDQIRDMISQINEKMVFDFHDSLMDIGPRYTGTETCARAAYYIYDEFLKMGLWTKFHLWEFWGYKCVNVIGTLNGSDPTSDAIIIMSAHFDTTAGSLGADDDASGVAAILAAAQVISQYNFPHTIQFIAFSGEEVGTYGSFMYAREASDRGDNIVAVINIDMVGYANTGKGGTMIRMFQAPRAAWITKFSKSVGKKYHNETGLSVQAIPNYRGADHQAFLEYGYDAVFFAHYDGYPWGNSIEDTPDHINHTYQVKATKFLLALVAELAHIPLDVQVILKNPKEGYAYLANYPILPFHWGRFYSTEIRGTTLILGQCTVQAEVKSNQEIDFVVFCIDDIFIQWDRTPPYEWNIQGKHYPPMGKHTLRVYAYDILGNIAQDEMDIIIFTLSYQYAPWNN